MSKRAERRAVTFIRVPAWSEERTPQYEEWYDHVHIPLRMRQPGFLGAQRYETLLGRQRYFVLYELADPGATESPEYLALRRWEASQPPDSFEAPATGRPGFERGVYDQIGGPSWPDPSLTTPVAHVAGYHPRSGREESFREWLAAVHAPSLMAMDGVTAVRVFTTTAHIFGGGAIQTQMHTPCPRLMTVTNLTGESVALEPEFLATQRQARGLEDEPDREPYVMIGRLVLTANGAPD